MKKGGTVKRSSGNPNAYGTKPVPMTSSKSTKTADNMTKRTSGLKKPGKS